MYTFGRDSFRNPLTVGGWEEAALTSHACWSLAESRAAVVKEEVSRPHDLDQRVTGYGTYGLLSVPMVSPLDGCFQAIMSGEWIRLRGGLGINLMVMTLHQCLASINHNIKTTKKNR